MGHERQQSLQAKMHEAQEGKLDARLTFREKTTREVLMVLAMVVA